MSMRRLRRQAEKRKERAAGRRTKRRLWVGGVFSPPIEVNDDEDLRHPAFVLWMDQRSGLIVGQDVVASYRAETALAETLMGALERPLPGAVRAPDRVRIADPFFVGELRATLGDAIAVEVAPTPELDEVFRQMLEAFFSTETLPPSYLEDGLPPESIAELFAAAAELYRIAPWQTLTDDQTLRMDIPELGVEGACLSVIGYLGESLGLINFPSLSAYDAFLRVAEERAAETAPLDFGTGWLALNFEAGAEIPREMRREIEAHRWPVAGAEAYPFLLHCERDGTPRSLDQRDVEIAAAGARAVAMFCEAHPEAFDLDGVAPVTETYSDPQGREVRITVPFEEFPFLLPPLSEREDVPDLGPVFRARQEAVTSRIQALFDFAEERFGDGWRRFERDFQDLPSALQLALPWAIFGFRIDGRTAVEWLLEERGETMPEADRKWYAAQAAAWLSVWEVADVEPGKTITLRDALSDEERCVEEVTASRSLVLHDAVLARIVDHDGLSLIDGLHPHHLPPVPAAEVVRRARGRLRRKRAVPVERLRDDAIGRYLIRRWEEALADVGLRASTPPEVRNTDGDPLLMTTDRFDFEAGARSEVAARLASMDGAEVDESAPGSDVFVFIVAGNRRHESWDNTAVGRAVLAERFLLVETSSPERADTLRGRIEEACTGLLRHRVRDHEDPLSDVALAGAAEPEPVSPQPAPLALEFKERHYAGWSDESLPALDGKTPREAARTRDGREAVDLLLKSMENSERRRAGETCFDFSSIRRELGLD